MQTQTLWFSRPAVKLSLSLIALAAVAACSTQAVGPNYSVPPEAMLNKVPAQQGFAGVQGSTRVSSDALPAHWWQLYQDKTLDGLIQQAFAHNTDLRQALANLEHAQAMVKEVGGAALPSMSTQAAPGYGHISGLSELAPGYVPPNAYSYSLSSGISYQLDVFGQIRRAIEAEAAHTKAVQAAVDLTRINVAAATARAYADVCSAGQRIKVMQRSIDLQNQSAELTERLQKAGKAGSLDAQRAHAQVEQLKADLPPLQAQRQNALFQLATLTGQPPQNFVRNVQQCDTAPQVAGVIPVGDGQALLRRRPDIRQAERTLAQNTAQIGVATADLYPKISLGLSAGSAGHMTGFGHGDTFSWNLGPLISWSIPINGVAQARVAQAEANTKAALAKFDGTVLTALRETETALNNYARELDRNARLKAVRAQSAQIAKESERLYANGKTGYLNSLDAQRTLANADTALAASEASLVSDQIALFLALGGGWSQDTTAQ